MSADSSPALSLLLVAVTAPLVPGVAARTRALLTGRRGAPVWQLYADLWKLVRRGAVYSTTTTWIFRFTPVALLATALVAGSLVPLDGHSALLRFPGDAVAFAYVLAFGRFALVLGALDTGSSFEGMGASREVTFATLVEFGLLITFAAAAVGTREVSLSGMLGGPHPGAWTGAGPSLALLATGLFALTLAECARVPVDDPTTHLELTMIHEVMVLDHGGPDLALILYASALKLSLFGALVLGLAVPRGAWPAPAAAAGLVAGLIVVGAVIGVIESGTARLRLMRVPLYIAGSAALSGFGLILLLR
jgi:formate hydrogenlyase subunit 4